MSNEFLALIGVVIAGVLAVIKRQQDLKADVDKTSGEIAVLKAKTESHVTTKQADTSALGEQQMSNIIQQLDSMRQMLERTVETITRKDEIIMGLQTTNFQILQQQVEGQKLVFEAQAATSQNNEMFAAAMAGMTRWAGLTKTPTEPIPVEVVNQEKPVPVEIKK